jgi:uncharacterized protein (TIGR00369 family)
MAKSKRSKKKPAGAKEKKKKSASLMKFSSKPKPEKKKIVKKARAASTPKRKTASKPTAKRKTSPSSVKHAAPARAPGPPTLVRVPLPGGVRPRRPDEVNERSAHLDKIKQLFGSAPISRYLGMSLGYCENGVARVRLPFRKEFEEGHGVIHGGLVGLLGDTAGSFAVGSVSPGSTVKTVEFKLSLLTGVQGDLLAIGEVVRKGRTLATCRLEIVEGNDRVVAVGLATYALQAI